MIIIKERTCEFLERAFKKAPTVKSIKKLLEYLLEKFVLLNIFHIWLHARQVFYSFIKLQFN